MGCCLQLIKPVCVIVDVHAQAAAPEASLFQALLGVGVSVVDASVGMLLHSSLLTVSLFHKAPSCRQLQTRLVHMGRGGAVCGLSPTTRRQRQDRNRLSVRVRSLGLLL